MTIKDTRDYTISETAGLLGVSYRQVLRYLELPRGHLRSRWVKVSPMRSQVRIKGKEIKRFVRSKKRNRVVQS